MSLYPMPVTPEWLSRMAADARLDSKEVALVFGYGSPASVAAACAHGHLPPPDGRMAGRMTPHGPRIGRLQWRADTIRREVRRRRDALASSSERISGVTV